MAGRAVRQTVGTNMASLNYSPRYPVAKQPKAALTVTQALEGAPTLTRLATLATQSQHWLTLASTILPSALHSGIQAGPIDSTPGGGATWCLLAANSAVAAKLRQLQPALCAHLHSKGCDVVAIRIKVQTRG